MPLHFDNQFVTDDQVLPTPLLNFARRIRTSKSPISGDMLAMHGDVISVLRQGAQRGDHESRVSDQSRTCSGCSGRRRSAASQALIAALSGR